MIWTILFWVGCYMGIGLLIGGFIVLGDPKVDVTDEGMNGYWAICRASTLYWPLAVLFSVICVAVLMFHRLCMGLRALTTRLAVWNFNRKLRKLQRDEENLH